MSDQKRTLRVRCPIVLSDARWIEERWRWLEDTFGVVAVKAAMVILPDEKCFPDQYSADMPSAERMLDRIAGYMTLESKDVELLVFSDAASKESPVRGASGAAGLYWSEGGKQKVAIAESNLENPLALAATLAHELGHVKLLGEGLISEETEDHEPLTDLLTVWQGLGVITSNAVLQENSWSSGLGSYWRNSRSGYLSLQMYGYALACFADSRGEDRPAWIKHLRADVRQAFLDSVAYRTAAGSDAGYEDASEEVVNDLMDRPKQVLFLSQNEAQETDELDEDSDDDDHLTMTAETLLTELQSGRRAFRHLTLSQLDLAGKELSGCDFTSSDFSDSNLTGTNLTEAILKSCDLADAILCSAVLRKADLRFASFRRADLSEAELQEADVRDTDFRACVLSSANFLSCRFNRQTNMQGAETDGAQFDSSLRFNVLGEPGVIGQTIKAFGPRLIRVAVALSMIFFVAIVVCSLFASVGVQVPVPSGLAIGASTLFAIAVFRKTRSGR